MAKQLGDVAKQVVARAISISRAATLDGEMEKGRSANAPAKVTGQRHAEGDDGGTANTGEVSRAPLTMSRGIFVASKARRPTSATNIPVFRVIAGGRPDTGGGTVPAGHTRDNGREPARELKLVWVR